MGKWLVDGLLLVDRQAAGQLDVGTAVECWMGGWTLAWWSGVGMVVG